MLQPRFKDEFGSQDFDLNPKVYSKGDGYAKQKIPKLKDEITKEYQRVSNENDLGAGSLLPLEGLVESLDRLFKILDVDRKFENMIV